MWEMSLIAVIAILALEYVLIFSVVCLSSLIEGKMQSLYNNMLDESIGEAIHEYAVSDITPTDTPEVSVNKAKRGTPILDIIAISSVSLVACIAIAVFFLTPKNQSISVSDPALTIQAGDLVYTDILVEDLPPIGDEYTYGKDIPRVSGFTFGRAVDGDTVVLLDKTQNERVRLFGIDAPEKGQPFAKEGAEYVTEMCEGQEIFLTVLGRDKYRRTLGLLDCGEVSINEGLLMNGLAWAYTEYLEKYKDEYPFHYFFNAHETFAKDRKLNIWSEENPIPPWEYRKNKKKNNSLDF
jgi:endonuclease YncB( thermonuclease family)